MIMVGKITSYDNFKNIEITLCCDAMHASIVIGIYNDNKSKITFDFIALIHKN